RNYYSGLGREIDIITLRGSLELAPVLGLSDVIVDIVETGTTLRENDLHVINFIADLSARLIANKSAYKFKGSEINEIIRRLTHDKDN
ncbi:MAG: ATP phosphoribosyltransferase, partial [Synergistaceae bacterium]|nr:ATP phosphoribosyltransferase [Synergistaceae bacterium]